MDFQHSPQMAIGWYANFEDQGRLSATLNAVQVNIAYSRRVSWKRVGSVAGEGRIWPSDRLLGQASVLILPPSLLFLIGAS